MSKLPKINKVLYEAVLPSNNKKILYRPFTVGEEKILLTAQQTEDISQMILATKQILNNCIQNYDVEDLAIFDAEYLLTKIRAVSVSDVVEIYINDEKDGKIPLKINLNDMKVTKDPNHTNIIKLDDTYDLHLKYPNLDILALMFDPSYNEAETAYLVLLNSLDKLVSEESVYNFADCSDEEINSFLDDLEKNQLDEIEKFFQTSPKMRHEIKYRNSANEDKTFVLEGTKSFFI